jgi:hypothetical protein
MAGPPKGNQNAAKAKDWESALRYALANYASKELKVQRGHALKKIAAAVVEKAISGDKDAWREIGDRLDGKPAQVIAGDNERPLTVIVKKFVRPGD